MSAHWTTQGPAPILPSSVRHPEAGPRAGWARPATNDGPTTAPDDSSESGRDDPGEIGSTGQDEGTTPTEQSSKSWSAVDPQAPALTAPGLEDATSPEVFAKRACALQWPGKAIPELSSELAQVLDELGEDPASVGVRRTHSLKYWIQRAAELQAEREELANTLEPRLKLTVGKLHIPLIRELAAAATQQQRT